MRRLALLLLIAIFPATQPYAFHPKTTSRRAIKSSKRDPRPTTTLDDLPVAIKVEDALRRCNVEPIPSTRAINGAIKVFADLKCQDLLDDGFSRSLGLFRLMRKTNKPTAVTYSTLMSRAVRLRKNAVALRLWGVMLRSDPPPPVDTRSANILMNAFAKESDPASCNILLDEMLLTISPSSSSANYTMLPPNTTNCSPNVVTYNTLVDALMRAGDLEGGLAVLKTMTANKIKPDITTFTTLISNVGLPQTNSSASYGSNDPDVAFQLFEKLQSPPYNLSPNGKTYCALINVCSRVRRPDLALKTLRLMRNEGWGEGGSKVTGNSKYVNQNINEAVRAWTATIDACGKSERVDTAITLFNSMVSSSVITPNEVTCSCLFDILLKKDKISGALDVIKYMKGANLQPTDYMYTGMLSVASRLLKNEEEMSKEIYVELMSLFSSKKSARNRRYNKRNSSGKDEDDQDVLMSVFLIFYAIDNPDLVCYNTLLSACARVGDVERSLQVLERIKDEELMPNAKTYAELLKCAYVAKDTSLSFTLWGDIKEMGFTENPKIMKYSPIVRVGDVWG